MSRIDVLERVEVDESSLGVREEAESDFVFGVGLREQVVEDGPVTESDATSFVTVGDAEQNGILLTLDLVLRRGAMSVFLTMAQIKRKGFGEPWTVRSFTYVVFALWRNGVYELLFVHKVDAAFLVLLCILQKFTARLAGELWFVFGADQGFLDLLFNRCHNSEISSGLARQLGVICVVWAAWTWSGGEVVRERTMVESTSAD